MDIVGSSYMPGDPRLVQQIVCELKSQGIFDQFRKECIADVDTKPAYQNLRQRVEGSVAAFLKQQNWCSDMNKNQVREQLRKSIYESGYLDTGVERIVDQVVNPKINTVFLPQVEEVVYRFLGLQKPVKEETKISQKVDIADLLPTDLEAVSPESVPSETEVDTADNSTLTASKTEEDESPPFEPLDSQADPVNLHEENSVDSHLSGFSGLQSHDSNHDLNNANVSQMDLSIQDSQISQNSSDGRLSIVISEDTKMDVDLEPKNVTLISSEIKTPNDVVLSQDHDLKSQEDRKYHKDKKHDRKHEERRRDEKRDKKSDDKGDEKNNDKKKDKSSDRKNKKGDKHVSRSSDKNSKSSSSSGSKEREKDKYKERNRSTSKHTSKHKHKEIDKKGTDRKDIDSNNKEEMNRGNDQKGNDKKDAERKDSDKKSKSKYVSPEKTDKSKKKEKDEKSSKEKSDKEEKSKEKTNRDKEEKNKDTPEKNKEKSHRERSDKKRESAVDKSDKSKEKEKSSSSKGGSNHSSSNPNSKDKRKDKETKSSSSCSSKYKDKTNKSGDDDSKSKHKKDTKRDKQSADDHYSFKDKKRNRRSTDRDSNDGNTERSRHISLDNTISTSSQKHSSDAGDTTSSGGGNNSGNSDKVESENPPKSPDDESSKTQFNEVEKLKYIKPKFASNLKEAMRIMKIRRQIAKLERQNQLSLVVIDSPLINGITSKEDTYEDSTERIEKVKHCEKVLNIILDRNDAVVQKVVSKEAAEVEEVDADKNSANREVADDKSEYFVEQQRFVLQTKDLSKENWEALEARLAEEMSNIDCSSYDYCDDYDCSDSEVVISSATTETVSSAITKIHSFDKNDEKNNTSSKQTMTVVNTVEGDDGTFLEPIHSLKNNLIESGTNKQTERSDNNVFLTMLETRDDIKIEQNKDFAINEEVLEVVELPLLLGNIVNEEIISTERSEMQNKVTNLNISSVVEDTDCTEKGIIAAPESIECGGDKIITKDEVTMVQGICVSEEVLSPTKTVKSDTVMEKHEVDTIQTVKSDMIEEIQFVEQVVEVGQDDSMEVNKSFEINGPFMLMEPIETVEEIIATADNPGPDSECRYLEMPTPYLEKNLANLYRFIKKLEGDVKHCIKACQNNFAPSIGVRGMKRKFDAIVDIKNNNKHHYEENISSNAVALERFPFPPSPADSEKSCDKKENEIMRPAKQRRLMMRNNSASNPKAQRYSSDDLYKPRPVFGSSRRSRSAKVNES